MKMRLLLTLAGLAFSFALPTFAQEENTVDPEVRQQIEAVLVKYDEAFNKHDAAAVAALFTQGAVEVLGWEPAGGRQTGKWLPSVRRNSGARFRSSLVVVLDVE